MMMYWINNKSVLFPNYHMHVVMTNLSNSNAAVVAGASPDDCDPYETTENALTYKGPLSKLALRAPRLRLHP